MNQPIYITSYASVSPLGNIASQIWEAYLSDAHLLQLHDFGENEVFAGFLNEDSKELLDQISSSDDKYSALDPTVLMALYASRKAFAAAGWQKDQMIGINIGSSRGATSLFEKYHKEFLENNTSSTLSSPTTTLGNISSWVCHDLQVDGPEVSHSITCSTALHSLLNGVAWIQAGMVDRFIVGGSEAPLTPFTVAQMQALKVYSRSADAYPSQALNLDKKFNTMVLGEGCSVICMEKEASPNAIAKIEGIGYATEVLKHNISISTKADCFQKSMKMALGSVDPTEVDVIVMHAPGTIKGDTSEYYAIQEVFGENIPALTTNKWKIGHTFGASGLLSLELGLLMLQKQQLIKVPFVHYDKTPQQINKIMVNAVGFGGNAVSVLISKI